MAETDVTAPVLTARGSGDESVPGVRGVIFDWGGVLTNPIIDTVDAWLETDRIDRDSYVAAMRPWIAQAYGPETAESPVHGLERGELADAEFEAILAGLLVSVDGGPVPPAGLLRRMFAATAIQDDMVGLVRELRAHGLRTGLLSNSWGLRDGYPTQLLDELFDEVVISCDVGMRKPEERIFQLALDRLGLAAQECAFVDDVEGNVIAAQAVGLLTVHHQEPTATRAKLSELLARPGPPSASALALGAMADEPSQANAPREPNQAKPPRAPYPYPTSEARSANMRGNRRANTKPELALRRALHGRGYRFRKDYRLDLADGVRVRPDIVFTARKVAVFVDGCFWHCCPDHGSQPSNNTWYWEPKLLRNVERDRAADAALGQAGWTVIRFWEHDSIDSAVAQVVQVLAGQQGIR